MASSECPICFIASCGDSTQQRYLEHASIAMQAWITKKLMPSLINVYRFSSVSVCNDVIIGVGVSKCLVVLDIKVRVLELMFKQELLDYLNHSHLRALL